MARLRKFCAYRRVERPYTRFSKFKKYSFIRARPGNRITRYTSGAQLDYPFNVHLVAKSCVQIRSQALESARLAANRAMEKVLGKQGFFLQIRLYPHHVLRENPLASGAGADRLSTGMKHSFGKPIGVAAQVRDGQEMITIRTGKENVRLAKNALRAAAHKLPLKCSVVVKELARA
ncbi:50S ribosomal protein L16 [Candidatus Woesearchaeota archaeon]|nr:MAG: 50S ribosomal protein L16 [Candidatus Woesearchaeota archaeon]